MATIRLKDVAVSQVRRAAVIVATETGEADVDFVERIMRIACISETAILRVVREDTADLERQR